MGKSKYAIFNYLKDQSYSVKENVVKKCAYYVHVYKFNIRYTLLQYLYEKKINVHFCD